MKIRALVFILMFYSSAFSQKNNSQIDTIPKVDGQYEYRGVVELDTSFNKDVLYKNAKVYFVDNFKSANDVIQYDDKEEGKIIGKGLFTITESQMILLNNVYDYRDVYYTTEITCKDGKYRYRLYDFSIKGKRLVAGSPSHYEGSIDDMYQNTQKGSTKKMDVKLFNKMVSHLKLTIENIKDYMSKKANISKDDF